MEVVHHELVYPLVVGPEVLLDHQIRRGPWADRDIGHLGVERVDMACAVAAFEEGYENPRVADILAYMEVHMEDRGTWVEMVDFGDMLGTYSNVNQ